MPRHLSLRWCMACALGLSAMQIAWADPLEDRMKGCNWDQFDSQIAPFRENRARLPPAIEVNFNSCDAGGPSYVVKAATKAAVLQDAWKEGETTVHSFAKKQPSPNYWIFEYQGYEWSGTTFVHKRTAYKVLTPGNDCGPAIFHPSGNRAVIRCSPEYATDQTELYHVALGSKVVFHRLQRNPPAGDLTVTWHDAGALTARFSAAGKRVMTRTYRTP